MRRLITPLAVLLLVTLAGCSSSSSPAATAVPPVATAVASSPAESAAPPASDAPVPSDAPASVPAAGGSAADFCGAFTELEAINADNPSDLAAVGAKFQAIAAKMRANAPADIAAAANTYATVIEGIGKAAAGGTVDQAALAKAISDSMAGNAKDIGTIAVWVAKNCSS